MGLSGAVRGQDDFEGPQAIEAARARGPTLGYAVQEIRQHERVHVFAHVCPRRGAFPVVEGFQRLREGVDIEDAGGTRYPEGHIAPGRVTVPAGPAGVDGGEGAVGEGAAFEIEGQDGGVVGLSCSEKRVYLRVDALHLDVEHPAQDVGEVDGVVHYGPSAGKFGVEEPAAGDLAVVRAVDGENAPKSAPAYDLPRPDDGGEVAHGEGCPELATG